MLKNKKAIYILIPVNLLVWGFFIYRFWSAYNSADTPVNIPKLQALKLDDIKDSTAYILRPDYKDPFLKDGEKFSRQLNTNITANTTPANPPKQAAPVKAAPPPKQLPDIVYMGLIKNNSSGTVTALISLNGQSRLIKPNETLDGITFKSFNKDSLVARWGKEKIVVRK